MLHKSPSLSYEENGKDNDIRNKINEKRENQSNLIRSISKPRERTSHTRPLQAKPLTERHALSKEGRLGSLAMRASFFLLPFIRLPASTPPLDR